jgi:holo-[acyl-carrier protein] synthase
MIKGIGTDIVEISRIKKLLDKHDEKHLKSIYTEEELKITRPERLAGRFAAKEALSKAFGTGMGKEIWFNKVEIKNDDSGKPEFIINEPIQKLLDERDAKEIHLSISHEKEYSVAFVIIE